MSRQNELSPIHIAPAKDADERERVLLFLKPIIGERYHCAPLPLPDIILVASRGSEIVGTVAVEFSGGDELFSLEEVYEFDRKKTPLSFERDRMAQFGRWAASVPGISGALLYASAACALGQGKSYGLGEAKERILERFREFGLLIYFVDAELVPQKAPEASRNYYTIPPQPRLFMVDLKQKEEALRKRTLEEVERGKIIIDPSITRGVWI